MADYTSQFAGAEIDARLAKVPQLEYALANSVKYTSQSLTPEQKAQARANIGAQQELDSAIQDAVDEYLEEHPAVIGTMPNSAKRILISLLEKVAFIDGNGQQYINALHAALNDVAIDHIVAVFTQGTKKVYDIDNLDVLKQWLVVTAYYIDGTHGEIYDYELSGTLTYGTSTITVTADEKTDTFEVVVTGAKKLYYYGDECSALTGGWQAKGFNLSNASPSKTKETNDLLVRFASHVRSGGEAGTWSTTNQIDLTGYPKIVIELERNNASGRGDVFAVCSSTLAEATTLANAFGNDYLSNRTFIASMGGAGRVYPTPAINETVASTITTENTSAYVSVYINLYTDQTTTPSTYPSDGAYMKIKRVFLATD